MDKKIDGMLEKVEPSRRDFMKKLAIGTAYAVPVLASFSLDSVRSKAFAQGNYPTADSGPGPEPPQWDTHDPLDGGLRIIFNKPLNPAAHSGARARITDPSDPLGLDGENNRAFTFRKFKKDKTQCSYPEGRVRGGECEVEVVVERYCGSSGFEYKDPEPQDKPGGGFKYSIEWGDGNPTDGYTSLILRIYQDYDPDGRWYGTVYYRFNDDNVTNRIDYVGMNGLRLQDSGEKSYDFFCPDED